MPRKLRHVVHFCSLLINAVQAGRIRHENHMQGRTCLGIAMTCHTTTCVLWECNVGLSPAFDSVQPGIGQFSADLAPPQGKKQKEEQQDYSSSCGHPRI